MEKELEENIIKRLAIGDGFRRSASRVPNKVALIEKRDGKDLRVTYKELNDQLNRFVRAMRGLGLKKGDRVACLGPNSIKFAVVLYGSPKGGFTFVPINFMLAPEDILHILNDAEVKVFVFDDALIPIVLKVMERKPKTVEHYVFMPITKSEIPENRDLLNFDEIVNRQSPEEVEDVIIWEKDIAEISYSSGATAAPKGAMLSHLSMYIPALQTLIEMAPHLNQDSILGMPLPIFHCGGRTFTTSCLFIGGTVVLFRNFDPIEILKGIERERINLFMGLPMMWRGVFFHPDFNKYDTSSVTSGIYGMAPMDEKTLEFLVKERGIALYLNSGQTEFFPPTNYRKPQWQLPKEGNYWGAPGIVVDGAIMDDEGNLLPAGEVGEIVWRGPACMEGYLKNPKATAKSRKFGWHHSEDLGFIDEDGLLKFVDRKKDMIKSGGENVSSIKVEEAILTDSRVASVAVLGLPHEKWGEAVTAFVVPKKEGELTEEDVISLCKESLAVFEIPKKVVFVDRLPITSTGKMRKVDLREEYKDLLKEN
jgi:long-chain acyl-CoA synthetase